MAWNRHTGILLGLCTAIAACDAPTENSNGTEAVESPSLAAAASGWTRTASMARARTAAAAATIGSTIYVVGGTPSSTGEDQRSTTTLQAYNTRTNSWSLRRPLPMARAWMNGATVINGRIYVSGGGYIANTLFVYNPATDTWARKADMPATASYGAQGAIGGFLYVYGGGSAVAGPSKFWRYNPATNTWASRPAPPNSHTHGEAGVIGGKLYLAGGEDEYLHHGHLDVYNPATNSWITRAPLPNPLAGMASAVFNGRLYLAGGDIQGGGRSLAELLVYDPATNTWSSGPPLPVARAYAAGAPAAGRFFVMGGWLTGGATTARVDAYSP